MYCDAEMLAQIENELVDMRLAGIYPDWTNGIIYLYFRDISKGSKFIAIKNNYFAGMRIVQRAKEAAHADP